jgi:putative aldouronate transport system permease protein
VNVPHILPTIVTLLIMRTGSVLSVGFEKIFLMQTPLNLEASRVLSTYVYEMGIQKGRLDYATAVGLFNNLVNVAMLLIVNTISKKLSETSIF